MNRRRHVWREGNADVCFSTFGLALKGPIFVLLHRELSRPADAAIGALLAALEVK
jgi:hypothetical protein